MGKTKQKTHKHEEYHLQQIRHMRKELKRKDQRIRQLEKELNFKPDVKEKTRSKIFLCNVCGKGELQIMDIGIRCYLVCQLCKHRERTN